MIIVLCLFVTLGCGDEVDPKKVASAVGQTLRYELRARPDVKQGGIRSYATTDYEYSEIRPAGRRVLWTRTEREKYAAHWVSPSGRVWVLTESTAGPGGAGRLWLRSPTGDLLGSWPSYMVFQRGPATNNASTAPHASELVAGGGRADEIKANVAERLRFPLRDGSEVRVVFLWPTDPAKSVALQGRPTLSGESLLEQALENPELETPAFERPLGDRSSLTIWRANALKPGGPSLTWLGLMPWQGAGTARTMGRLQELRQMERSPDYVTRTPGNRILWFEFVTRQSPGRGVLRVMDTQGDEQAKVDLVAVGRFGSAKEAKESLKWQQPSFAKGQEWLPLSEVKDGWDTSREQVELWDRRGRRFVVTIAAGAARDTVKTEVQSGLRARRPKEDSDRGRLVSEESVYSQNRRFKLRTRWFEREGEPRSGRLTLCALAPEASGTQAEVELWSTFILNEPAATYVTNSGRSLVFNFERIRSGTGKEPAEVATLIVRSPSGRQLAGLDLTQPEGYSTAAEAKRSIRWDAVALASKGKRADWETEGLRLPVWTSEEATLAHRDGRVVRISISGNPAKDTEGVSLARP